MKLGSKFPKTAGLAGLVFGLCIGNGVVLAQNEGNNLQIVPVTSAEFGNTYGEWSARWWQWLLSVPEANNPNNDTTGADCARAQTGQVWFLAGSFSPGSAVTRSCTIPAGEDVLLTPRNAIFGELGAQDFSDCKAGPSTCDPTAVRKLAAADVDSTDPGTIRVTIDGVRIQNIAQYRVTAPVFSAFFPQGAIFGIETGSHGPLISDGYWLLLRPLSPGRHTIFSNGITWRLTVTR